MKNVLTVFISILICGSGFGQITLTSTDAFNLIGSPVQTVKTDTLEATITVDIGTAGENQIWNFSALTYPSEDFKIEYIVPTGTPFEEDFPGANFTEKRTLTTDTTTINIFEYMRVTTDSLNFLGNGVQIEGLGTLSLENEFEYAPLPLTYGTSWTLNRVDTVGFLPPVLFVEYEDIQITIDGWGMVTVPAGTFECLRLHSNWQVIEHTISDGVIIDRDTTAGASFSWLGKNSLELANFNFEFDTGVPQFTEADELSLLTEIAPAAIRSTTNTISDYILEQNYPNPFNPVTTIGFTLPQRADVRIEVYSMSGQRVATVLNETRSAGSHTIKYNAEALSSGVYVYKLVAGDFTDIKKMIVIK